MTYIADFFFVIVLTLCVSVLVICESVYCALFEVLADSVFYRELIFDRNNITFQMKSNDVMFVRFFSFLSYFSQTNCTSNLLDVITGSIFVLHMQGPTSLARGTQRYNQQGGGDQK